MYRTFRGFVITYFLSSIILGVFIAILPEGDWQMALTTLTLLQAVFLIGVALLFLPNKWMSNEITIKNTTVVKEVYKIKGAPGGDVQ